MAAIAHVSPPCVVQRSRTMIEISGCGLRHVERIEFNPVPGTRTAAVSVRHLGFVSRSETRIRFPAPVLLAPGRYQVVAKSRGGEVATAAQEFEVTPAPPAWA
jgi:hypothetical protein